eukprot:2392194-Prymnesium_polylepis.1
MIARLLDCSIAYLRTCMIARLLDCQPLAAEVSAQGTRSDAAAVCSPAPRQPATAASPRAAPLRTPA